MDEKQFESYCGKTEKIARVKVALARLMRENNMSFHVRSDGERSIEILIDFYLDGDPIPIFSSLSKEEEKNFLDAEDLIL